LTSAIGGRAQTIDHVGQSQRDFELQAALIDRMTE
jgi:hypothetical protein